MLSMQLTETALTGVYVIEIIRHDDARGFFARTWDARITKEYGLCERFDYAAISVNRVKHTLRGMHYQSDPHGEVKLVRCTRGAMFDVVIDLRPDSKTFKKWFGIELTADNYKALYIPPGCAHGFLTLEAGTEVLYHIAGDFVLDASMGVRFSDPAIGIKWPAKPHVISEHDAAFPDFRG